MPNYVISRTPDKVILRNYEGVITTYTQPRLPALPCTCDYCTGKKKYEYEGVEGLHRGQRLAMEPQDLLRHRRNKK